jgi:hypothetical protein
MKAQTDKPDQSATELLRTPIELTFTFLEAGALNRMRLKVNEAHREAVSDFVRQHTDRYKALFAHFGIQRSAPNAEFFLVIRMGMELFPQGFRYIRKGEKTRGNKARWTTTALLDLYSLVEKLRSAGLKVEEAAGVIATFKLLPKPMPAKESIVSRYYEAKKMVTRFRGGEMSDFEILDCAAFALGLEAPFDQD